MKNFNKKLKISVITTCLNSEKTIKNNLISVANQKYTEIEHIIIDGKSNDNTLMIVKEFPHVKKMISEIDSGIYDAMNKGIDNSTGDIISFLNSDDFYTNENVLAKVVDAFENNVNLDACYSDLIYVDRINISKKIRYWQSSNFKFNLFAKGWCPPHPTFFVRRHIYEKYGTFNLNYEIASDVELMMRFLETYKIKVLYINEVLVKMRNGGISNKSIKNIIKLNQEILHALQSHNIPYNSIIFFSHKIISRLRQFIN